MDLRARRMAGGGQAGSGFQQLPGEAMPWWEGKSDAHRGFSRREPCDLWGAEDDGEGEGPPYSVVPPEG